MFVKAEKRNFLFYYHLLQDYQIRNAYYIDPIL